MMKAIFTFIFFTGALLARMPVPEDIEENKIRFERLISEVKADGLFDDDFMRLVFDVESEFEKIKAIYDDMDASVSNLPFNQVSILKESLLAKMKLVEQRYSEKKKMQLSVVDDAGSFSGGYSKRSENRPNSNDTPVEYVQPPRHDAFNISGDNPDSVQ